MTSSQNGCGSTRRVIFKKKRRRLSASHRRTRRSNKSDPTMTNISPWPSFLERNVLPKEAENQNRRRNNQGQRRDLKPKTGSELFLRTFVNNLSSQVEPIGSTCEDE